MKNEKLMSRTEFESRPVDEFDLLESARSYEEYICDYASVSTGKFSSIRCSFERSCEILGIDVDGNHIADAHEWVIEQFGTDCIGAIRRAEQKSGHWHLNSDSTYTVYYIV